VLDKLFADDFLDRTQQRGTRGKAA